MSTRSNALRKTFRSSLGCFWLMSLIGLVAMVAAEPMLFPSLGPTVLMFFDSPKTRAASPRNTLIGHVIALAAGWVSLAVCGLLASPDVLIVGVHTSRMIAAALSLGLTVFASRLVDAIHPPSGATTLIVSLGFLTTPTQLGLMLAAIVFVTVVGWLTNRLFGVDTPIWSAAD